MNLLHRVFRIAHTNGVLHKIDILSKEEVLVEVLRYMKQNYLLDREFFDKAHLELQEHARLLHNKYSSFEEAFRRRVGCPITKEQYYRFVENWCKEFNSIYTLRPLTHTFAELCWYYRPKDLDATLDAIYLEVGYKWVRKTRIKHLELQRMKHYLETGERV